MWQQLFTRISSALGDAWRWARPRLHRATVWMIAFARGPLRAAARPILHTLAALLLLFLEWGWQPLERAASSLSKYFVFARLESWIKSLPPYGALALFAAPALCLIPVKLFAIYLFASGHPILGVGLIIAAKVAGTGIVARIFMLTHPQLMEIGWFARGYNQFIPWKERMFAQIRASSAWRNGRIARVEVKRTLNRTWIGLKPHRAWLAAQTVRLRADVKTFLASVAKSLR